MKLKNYLIILFLSFCTTGMTQILIDGRQASYDSLSHIFLATIPEASYYSEHIPKIELSDGWHFIENDNYDIDLCDSLGNELYGNICYTFLPILSIKGDIENEFQEGILLMSNPECKHSDTLAVSIKRRGGTTNSDDKHKLNYKIKLKADTTLFGLRNDDNWILDAGQADVFRFRNKIAMDIWNDINCKPYYAEKEPEARLGVSGVIVELFVNDEYHGVYNFSENLDRKQLKLKKVDKNTGEIRGCLYKSEGWGVGQMYDNIDEYSNYSETLQAMEVKYPDLTDNDSTDWSTLVNAINFVVNSSNSEFDVFVADYFDLPVIMDFYIFGAAMNAYDNRGKNLLWAVYNKNKDKKLTLAPWDLDCTVGQRWVDFFNETLTSPDTIVNMRFNLTKRLHDRNSCDFSDNLIKRYAELRNDALSTDRMKSHYVNVFNMLKNSGALGREEYRWSGDTDIKGESLDIEEELAYILDWIERHMTKMDKTFKYEPTFVSIAEMGRSNTDNNVYNTRGQRISPYNIGFGVYIKNGRKIIFK